MNDKELQLQIDLPDDPSHMQFLQTLDIDGISEHTQLFRLKSYQVNQILRDTIRQHIQRMNLKELLRPDPFDNEPPEHKGYVDDPSLQENGRQRMDPKNNLNLGGGLYFGNQVVQSGISEVMRIS